MFASVSMHHIEVREGDQKAFQAGGLGCDADEGGIVGFMERYSDTATSDGKVLCLGRTVWDEADEMAEVVASPDSGLFDCSDSKHENPDHAQKKASGNGWDPYASLGFLEHHLESDAILFLEYRR